MKKICTICARGGSKGIPGKNIVKIAGKPLIAYTILQAKSCNIFDAIAVSSDSEKILDISKKYGIACLIKRPNELSNDKAPKLPAIRHCVEEAEKLTKSAYDIVVDLDATSPLRRIEDIKAVVDLLTSRRASNVITGTPARRSPYFNMVELSDAGYAQLVKPPLRPIIRRQDAPACFDMNASIYAWHRKALFEKDTVFNHDTLLYVMPEENSIDIDSELDFEIVNFIMDKRSSKL